MNLRRLSGDDSLAELTALLNRAYGAHAANGLRYVASYQDEEVTRRRIAAGECWLGEVDGRVVATVTVYPPGSPSEPGKRPALYDRPDVAYFGQLGVEPELQGTGLGSILLDHVERRAQEFGAATIACDTAEGAARLIAMYENRGYRLVDYMDWRPATNYRSIVLSKALA